MKSYYEPPLCETWQSDEDCKNCPNTDCANNTSVGLVAECIYLPKQVSDIFNMYGGVEVCVNRILDEWSMGNFDIGGKPAIQLKTQCRRYDIVIRNVDYIELRKLYPSNSSKLSLRRLCEWYVTNELYAEWTDCGCDSANTQYQNALARAAESITNLEKYSNGKNQTEIQQLSNIIRNLIVKSLRS